MDETNPDRAFQEEKLRMVAAKGAMTKKVKRLNTALTLFLMGFLTNGTLWGADLPPLVIWQLEDIFNILF